MSAESENLAEDLVDHLVSADVDWRDLVRAYPKTALALSLVGGFALGRARGTTIVAALATHTADTLASNINEFLGDEVL